MSECEDYRYEKLTPEERIKILSTPYEELPLRYQKYMVKRPCSFEFIRVDKEKHAVQKETFAVRMIRFMEKYNVSPEGFCDLCNDYAKWYDFVTNNKKHQV